MGSGRHGVLSHIKGLFISYFPYTGRGKFNNKVTGDWDDTYHAPLIAIKIKPKKRLWASLCTLSANPIIKMLFTAARRSRAWSSLRCRSRPTSEHLALLLPLLSTTPLLTVCIFCLSIAVSNLTTYNRKSTLFSSMAELGCDFARPPLAVIRSEGLILWPM